MNRTIYRLLNLIGIVGNLIVIAICWHVLAS